MEFTPLITLDIKDNKQLHRFYSQWSVNASKLIQKYAAEHSLDWFNTKWRNKSKEIPFYIRTKAPRSFIGNVFFASNPTNYVYAKDVSKLKDTRKAFPRGITKTPVKAYGRWFMPKKFKADIDNLNQAITDSIGVPARFFVSKTSHNKTHKYKRPMLWYQSKSDKSVGPVTLKEQLSDYIAQDPEAMALIMNAFEQTIEEKKYLK